jgi:hypothetical protein
MAARVRCRLPIREKRSFAGNRTVPRSPAATKRVIPSVLIWSFHRRLIGPSQPFRSYDARSDTRVTPAKEILMAGKILIVAAMAAILYNLGAGLYYMMVDNGSTGRTVNALTWRIGLSVGLILAVIFSIWMGWIQPHGIGR